MINSLLLTLSLLAQGQTPDFNMLAPPSPPRFVKAEQVKKVEPPDGVEKPPTARIVPLEESEKPRPPQVKQSLPPNEEQSMPDVPLFKPTPVREVYVYVGKDKFGRKYKAASEAELDNILSRENAKNWELADRWGKVWTHPVKEILERDVEKINAAPRGTFRGKNEPEQPVVVNEWPQQRYIYNTGPVYTVSPSFGNMSLGGCAGGSCSPR